MKLERLAFLTRGTLLMALAGALAACAADRSKDVRSAEANLTSEQQQARYEESKLDQKQAQQQAQAQQDPSMTPNDRAELQQKQVEERADQKEDNAKNISEAEKDVTKANAEMQNDRAKTDAEIKSKIQKAEARFWEAKNKSAKIAGDGKARTRFNDKVNLYKSKKADVDGKVANMMRASVKEWNDAKNQAYKATEELENLADRLHDDF
jgi:hypothetical protein